MFCTQCGANIEADPRYCWKCGHVFTPEEIEKMRPGSRVQAAAPAPAPAPAPKVSPAQGQPARNASAQSASQAQQAQQAQNRAPQGQGAERRTAGSGYQGRAAQAPPAQRPPQAQQSAEGAQPGAGAVKIFAIIMGIVFAIFALMSLGGVFSNLGSIFSARGFGHVVSRLLFFLLALLRLVCLAGAAGVLFYMFASWKNSKARSFYITLVIVCGVLLCVDLLRYLVIHIVSGSWHGSAVWLLRDVIALLVAVGGMYIIMSVNKMSVLEGVAGESMGDVVSGALNGFKDDVSSSAAERSAASAAKAQAAGQRQANAGGAQRQAAPAYASANTDPLNLPPGNGGLGPLKTDRSLLLLIVLNLLTCSFYNLYFIYKLAQDVNILCEGDGKETPGLLKYFCFTFITCGFYAYFWWYNLCNRMQENAPRYGLRFSENGTSYLVWTLVGAMSCGVGYFYATYMVLRNMNELCKQYNKN